MQLCECKIELEDKKIYLYQTVEQSLQFIEQQAHHNIKTVNIAATDGEKTHHYHYCNIEESLENLMNL